MTLRSWGSTVIPLVGVAVVAIAAVPAHAELKVGVSGYIKLDIQYGDKDTGDFPSPGPASTPLDPDAARSPETFAADKEKDHGQTILDARQSRLSVRLSDDVAGVKISGRVEADFFNGEGTALTSNSRNFRLRHAFVRGDHPSGFFLLAGQTWSLLMNVDTAQPELVDFNGPAGQMFAREPQLRVGYRMPLGGALGELVFEANVEKQSTPDLGATSINEAQGQGQDIPLFSGKVSWLTKVFQLEAAGAVAQNRVTLTGGGTTDEMAWAIQVSAQVDLAPVTKVPLTIFGHYQHVDGLERLANGDFPTAFLVGSQIQNVESDGLFGGLSWKVRKNTTVNAVYGYAKADEIQSAGFTGNQLETQQSIHVNVIHKFWERWQVGLEYRRFDVDAFNGRTGAVNGVLGAIWYFF